MRQSSTNSTSSLVLLAKASAKMAATPLSMRLQRRSIYSRIESLLANTDAKARQPSSVMPLFKEIFSRFRVLLLQIDLARIVAVALFNLVLYKLRSCNLHCLWSKRDDTNCRPLSQIDLIPPISRDWRLPTFCVDFVRQVHAAAVTPRLSNSSNDYMLSGMEAPRHNAERLHM